MFTYQTTVLYCLVPKLTRKPTFYFFNILIYFIFVFGHLIKYDMKMDNKLKNINYLINFII